MQIIQCPKDIWTLITPTPVKTLNFVLRNYFPDHLSMCVYKIYSGITPPSILFEDIFIVTQLDRNGKVFSKSCSYNNSTPEQIWVKSLYSDGSVAI